VLCSRKVYRSAAVACLALSAIAASPYDVQAPIALTVETPADGSTVGGADGTTVVAGRAVSQTEELLDIVLAIDTSKGAT
jgi:hypothetical protein